MSRRNLLKTAFALLGLALFVWLLSRVDLPPLLQAMGQVGLAGFGVILLVYALEFLCDVIAWRLVLGSAWRRASSLWGLYLVRMAGEAYNVVTPAGGMGGEPVKALILRRRYGVPYVASSASLVLAKTSNVVALVAFLAVGFVLMLEDPRIPAELRYLAGTGLAALTAGIGGFFLVQRLRVASRLSARLGPRRPWLARLAATLAEFDQQLVAFYTRDPLRFLAALTLGFGNWIVGAAGVWLTLMFMQQPVSFVDAWIIEAMAQMVRAATFFIPAGIGAQEGIIMLVMGAMTGNPVHGLAVALLRRARELVWVLAGLAASVPLLGGQAASPAAFDAAREDRD